MNRGTHSFVFNVWVSVSSFFSSYLFLFLTGCDLLFTDETEASIITHFPQHDFHQKAINVPVNNTCSFYYGGKIYAQYLSCDGAWNEVQSQSMIDSLDVTRGWTTSRLQIRVGFGTV